MEFGRKGTRRGIRCKTALLKVLHQKVSWPPLTLRGPSHSAPATSHLTHSCFLSTSHCPSPHPPPDLSHVQSLHPPLCRATPVAHRLPGSLPEYPLQIQTLQAGGSPGASGSNRVSPFPRVGGLWRQDRGRFQSEGSGQERYEPAAKRAGTIPSGHQ